MRQGQCTDLPSSPVRLMAQPLWSPATWIYVSSLPRNIYVTLSELFHLCFLICKIKIILEFTHWVLMWGLNEITIRKLLEQRLECYVFSVSQWYTIVKVILCINFVWPSAKQEFRKCLSKEWRNMIRGGSPATSPTCAGIIVVVV